MGLDAMILPKLRAPIVLVHGLLGFSKLELCGVTFARYFSDIPEHLAESGNRVYLADVGPTRGVADRGRDLKNFIDRNIPGESFHLLAHSMGGLDARYMISRLGMGERVLTLTTIGTPHHGSSFADWGIRRLARLVKPVLELMTIPHQAFFDLTTHQCKQFNEQVPDVPGVRYFSIAGRHEGRWYDGPMQVLHQYVNQMEGPNDGIVSLASASYGESTDIWDGDHLSLINWPSSRLSTRMRTFDRQADYTRLVSRLADEGF